MGICDVQRFSITGACLSGLLSGFTCEKHKRGPITVLFTWSSDGIDRHKISLDTYSPSGFLASGNSRQWNTTLNYSSRLTIVSLSPVLNSVSTRWLSSTVSFEQITLGDSQSNCILWAKNRSGIDVNQGIFFTHHFQGHVFASVLSSQLLLVPN